MDFINKKFKNKVTGDVVTIVDHYQNIAITSDKEKINTNLLLNENLFTQVKQISDNTNSVSKQDTIDPLQFFDSQRTYNAFAETIKNTDLSKVKDDDGTQINLNPSTNFPVTTNESAVIFSDPNDEIEELKRKYGATTVSDSLRQQNETFAKILDPDQNVTQVKVDRDEVDPVRELYSDVNQNQITPKMNLSEPVNDPVTSMFRNVKRNVDFKINLKIDGKIPRLDFIEMMEDSYELSIVDFLAEEFTNKLLSDPSIIRNKVKEEIFNLINKNILKSESKEVTNKEVTTKRPSTKRTYKKESQKNDTGDISKESL
jgi:hypothetical protein